MFTSLGPFQDKVDSHSPNKHQRDGNMTKKV